MRIIRVPIKHKTLLYIKSIVLSLGFPLLLLGISLIHDDYNISIVITIILISILLLAAQWLLFTDRLILVSSDYIYRFVFVIHLIKEGFQVIKGKKEQTYLWKNISFVDLKGNNELVFQLKNRKTLTIDNLHWNWFLLLKNIPPEKTTNNQIEQFKEEIFFNLKTCPVCGKIAVYQQKCLSCRVDYSDIQDEYLEDQIKAEQRLFSIDEENETVNFYEDNNDGFEFDENWHPVITKEELIESYRFVNEETATGWINQLRKRFKT